MCLISEHLVGATSLWFQGEKDINTVCPFFPAVCPPEANTSATSAVKSILSGTLQSVRLSELMFRNFPLFTPHSPVRQCRKGSNWKWQFFNWGGLKAALAWWI